MCHRCGNRGHISTICRPTKHNNGGPPKEKPPPKTNPPHKGTNNLETDKTTAEEPLGTSTIDINMVEIGDDDVDYDLINRIMDNRVCILDQVPVTVFLDQRVHVYPKHAVVGCDFGGRSCGSRCLTAIPPGPAMPVHGPSSNCSTITTPGDGLPAGSGPPPNPHDAISPASSGRVPTTTISQRLGDEMIPEPTCGNGGYINIVDSVGPLAKRMPRSKRRIRP